MESRHCGQDKRIFFSPVHNASTPCSLQAFGIRCIRTKQLTNHCISSNLSANKVRNTSGFFSDSARSKRPFTKASQIRAAIHAFFL